MFRPFLTTKCLPLKMHFQRDREDMVQRKWSRGHGSEEMVQKKFSSGVMAQTKVGHSKDECCVAVCLFKRGRVRVYSISSVKPPCCSGLTPLLRKRNIERPYALVERVLLIVGVD